MLSLKEHMKINIVIKNKIEIIQIIIAIIILLFCLAPLFLLAQFAVPITDDFANGYSYFQEYDNKLGFAISEGINYSAMRYNTWQGTYLSSFLSFCNPFNFYGIAGLHIAFDCIIILYVVSVFLAVHSVMRYYFGCKKFSVTLWVYTSFIFLTTQLFNLTETIYWYTGAVAYIVPFSICLLALVLFIYAYRSDGKKMIIYLILSCVLAAAGCGGSLNINVFFFLTVFAVWGSAFYNKKARNKKIVSSVFLGTLIAFTLINALAPGYRRRTELEFSVNGEVNAFGEKVRPSIFKNIFRTLEGFIDINTVIVPIVITLAVIIVLVMLMLPYLKKKTDSFKHPGLLLCYILIMLYLCVAPLIFGYERYGIPNRFSTITGWMGIGVSYFYAAYLTGWFLQKREINLSSAFIKPILAVTGFTIFVIGLPAKPIRSWISMNILNQYDNMIIQKNYINVTGVLNHIENSEEKNVYIDYGMVDMGGLLWNFEISTDSKSMVNNLIATYYGKDSVQVIDPMLIENK